MTIDSPILVSKTRKGDDKFWQAHVVSIRTVSDPDPKWFTVTSYWQVNKDGVKSKVQRSEPYEATSKNVARANETSAKEQAILEFNAMVTKQRDRGYTEVGTISTILPLPMLAQKFADRGDKMLWPRYVQPKYNGQRMLFKAGAGWSRGGKSIIPQVIAHLSTFDTNDVIVDGELLLPDNKLLQETMQSVKKYRTGISETLLYVVYDIVDESLPFSKRYEKLKALVQNAPKNVILAPTYTITKSAEVMTLHKSFTAKGLEGTMVRDDSGGYTIGQRSNQLQKYKDFVDSEFKIIDVKQGEGKFKGCAIFVCETAAGLPFDCTPEGPIEYKKELYDTRKKHLGKWLTIRYPDGNISKDGKPQHLVGVSIRDIDDF